MGRPTAPDQPDLSPGPTARAWRTALAFCAGPAVVVGLVLGLAVWWLAGVIGAVVVAGALVGWAWKAGDSRVRNTLASATAADLRAHARLCNLVEGLSIGAGVNQPELLVIDSPGLNAMAAGTDPSHALVAVTSGLLEGATRIELEAVLAACIWSIRRAEIVPATVLAATFGLGAGLALRPDRDSRVDLGAVGLTRYPPALASALDRMSTSGTAVAGIPSWAAHLWLADPLGEGGPGRVPIAERAEALREL